MKQIRQKLDKMLFEGQGQQLLWLSVTSVVVLLILLLIGWMFEGMKWQSIVALFMDPGNFDSPEGHDIFRIATALLGAFFFSTLLISVFTNIFENISSSYKKGESIYSFKNHILIVGSARPLKSMLCAIRDNSDLHRKSILVMTASNVETLRSKMEIQLADPAFFDRISFFHRERNYLKYLKEACADKASMIYVIGEDGEPAHDALNIHCLNLLEELCGNKGEVIPCYLIMEKHFTLRLFNYMSSKKDSRLNVEVINESDYAVEQLLKESDFLPALQANDERRLHLVICGSSLLSRSFATIAAQICHYPNFKGAMTRTRFSLIGFDEEERDSFLASYRNLFDLSHYRYVTSEGTVETPPKGEYGDFLDIEWEFIREPLMSPSVDALLEKWATDPKEALVLAMCYIDDETNTFMSLHLPKAVYESGTHIAVHQNDSSEMMDLANNTGMFGKVFIFGNAHPGEDLLFLNRSSMGKRVNRVYDSEYGNPPAKDEEEAWRKLPYAHKQSSITSANSIPLKLRCFGIKPTQEDIRGLSEEQMVCLSEVEHRRWMATQLLMGYYAAPTEARKDRSHFKELKSKKFIHLDIAPYDELPEEEKKDTLIMYNIPYIMTGSQHNC